MKQAAVMVVLVAGLIGIGAVLSRSDRTSDDGDDDSVSSDGGGDAGDGGGGD